MVTRRKKLKIENSIKFKDGCYYVDLPWIENRVNRVPSNFHVTLIVLDRTMTSLRKNKLDEAYSDVFFQQVKDGIIERLKIQPEEFGKFIWIPQRPIIKITEQMTTKIRPIFNCSLKTHGNYSLNEAAYPGINLIKNLIEILLKFKKDKFVMPGGIKKAFLMIRLKTEKNQNPFCFFGFFSSRRITNLSAIVTRLYNSGLISARSY